MCTHARTQKHTLLNHVSRVQRRKHFLTGKCNIFKEMNQKIWERFNPIWHQHYQSYSIRAKWGRWLNILQMAVDYFSLDFRSGNTIRGSTEQAGRCLKLPSERYVCPLPAEIIPRQMLHGNPMVTILIPKKAVSKISTKQLGIICIITFNL